MNIDLEMFIHIYIYIYMIEKFKNLIDNGSTSLIVMSIAQYVAKNEKEKREKSKIKKTNICGAQTK